MEHDPNLSLRPTHPKFDPGLRPASDRDDADDGSHGDESLDHDDSRPSEHDSLSVSCHVDPTPGSSHPPHAHADQDDDALMDRSPWPTWRAFLPTIWPAVRAVAQAFAARGIRAARALLGTERPAVASLPDWSVAGLTQLLRQAAGQGALHPQAADIASRALGFGRLRVQDVMVPRNRIKAIELRASADTLRRVLLEEGHARMPVYEGTLDNIAGVLVARDVLALAWERSLIVLDDLLQPPYFAPEMMHATDLLKELQRRRLHFAVVVDELGGTAGIVTLEDLLEELVGDIYGEHDLLSPQLIQREADGSLTLEGIMPVREANRELDLGLPEGDAFTTVGGLCVSLAGRIPERGQRFEARDGLVVEVVEASARSVTRVRLKVRAKKTILAKTWANQPTNELNAR